MKNTAPVQRLILTAILLAAAAVPPARAEIAATGTSPLVEASLEPVNYLGPRNDEPLLQTIALARVRRGSFQSEDGWFLDAHLQAELAGSRQWLPDLNRAGYRNGRMIIGRVHPWEMLSGHPETNRPWGLAAQTQALNLGVELGYQRAGSPFREPILGGWTGFHLASTTEADAPLAFSLSASPLFIPTVGGQVRFYENQSAQATRFGRTPPTRVEIGGVSYPLFYRIDTTDLLQEVLLQPQFLVQGRYRTSPLSPVRFARLSSWFWVSRSPRPDPVPDASGVLVVDDEGVTAVAEVKPAFPQRWQLGLTQELEVAGTAVRSLLTVLTDFDSQGIGVEAALSYRRTRLSVLHRFLDEVGAGEAGFSSGSAARFDQAMLQLETAIAGAEDSWLWSLGAKAQLGASGASAQSVWLASALDWRVNRAWTLRLAGDLYGGADGTYFGDWRTNDRVSATLTWAL